MIYHKTVNVYLKYFQQKYMQECSKIICKNLPGEQIISTQDINLFFGNVKPV